MQILCLPHINYPMEAIPKEILLKNREIADLDNAVKDARSALQLVVPYRRKVPRTMLFIDDSREDSNVPLVSVLVRRPFTLQQSYVRVQEEGTGISKKKRKAAIAEAPVLEAVRVRIVKPTIEGVNGFLNPWFPVPITFKGQGYLHAYQAAMAALAAAWEKKDNLAANLRTTGNAVLAEARSTARIWASTSSR